MRRSRIAAALPVGEEFEDIHMNVEARLSS
jgi:hypothetical protein